MSAPALDRTPASTVTGPHPTTKKPRLSTFRQWWILVMNLMKHQRVDELFIIVSAPVIFVVSFYIQFSIPWNRFVGGASSGLASNLGQYITPMVTLQAVGSTAIGSAFWAAIASQHPVTRRYRSMPMAPLTPLLARVSFALFRCGVGLAVSLSCGYVIGFRFHRGPLFIMGFCILALVIGVMLSFGADLVGTATRNPEAMVPLLTLPLLIFGLLSDGLMPLKLFPRWIHPLVRNQPISQFVEALRALAGDTTKKALPVTWPVMAPTLGWLLAFAMVLVPSSIIVLSKRS